MHIVDANVLLHAVNQDSEQHPSAADWLGKSLSGGEPVGFAWVVLLGFLRISTRAGVFPSPLSVATAFGYVEEWLARPSALIVAPTSRHVGVLRGLLEPVGTGGNLTTDAHLAALAVEHGATLWSFDRDFARFPGLRWSHPA